MEKSTRKLRIPYILALVGTVVLISFLYVESEKQKTIPFGVDAKQVAYMTVNCYPVLHGGSQMITDKKLISKLLSEANEEEFYYWGSHEKRQNKTNVVDKNNTTCFTFYNQAGECIGKIKEDTVCGGYVVSKEDGYYIYSGEKEHLQQATGAIIELCKEGSSK